MLIVLSWLKRWWKVLLGVLGAITVGLAAVIAVGEVRRKSANFADAIALEKSKRKIEKLRRQRADIVAKVDADEKVVADIDEALEENKVEIEAVRRRAGVDPAELLDELERLGY